MNYLLGLDLGTSAIKIGLFDAHGKRIGVETEAYELLTPAANRVEMPVPLYWESFKKSLTRLLEMSDVSAAEISAISFSTQSETMVCLDNQGEELGNAIVWLDNRATEEALYLASVFSSDELYRMTGQPEMQGIWPAAKILWIKNHEAERFQRTAHFLLLEDYFIYRLTGNFYGEGSLWSTSLLIDIEKNDYWDAMLEVLGISREQLPNLQESCTAVGTLLPAVAKELGLSEKMQVVLGGQDQICGSVGAGNVREGIFTESTGTALASCMTLDSLRFDPDGKMPLYRSCLPGKYFISAFGSGGASYRWLKDLLYPEQIQREGTDYFEKMNLAAEEVAVGSEGLLVLPHFQGAQAPDADPYATCTVLGLTLGHGRGHLTRAFLEGVALVLNRMVESCEAMGCAVEEIRSISGGAKSPLWCQIKADICNKKVITMNTVTDAACLGAAILAGVGVGVFVSAEDAADAMVHQTAAYEPRPQTQEVYGRLKEQYLLAMREMKDLNLSFKAV